MAFNNRVPVPLDPDADPNLPQADASQPHDIPTGVSPTTAKLQDWIAWLRENAVIYLTPGTPGTISNDIIISGDLTVTGELDLAGAANFGSSLAVGTTITGASLTTTGALSGSNLVLTGTQPASTANPGANTLHSTSMAKVWAYAETVVPGTVTIHDGFNVASAAVSGLSIRFTFARPFTSALYAASATSGNTASFALVTGMNANYVDVGVYSIVGAGLRDPATETVRVHLSIMGRR
jgi:hypothetical protein